MKGKILGTALAAILSGYQSGQCQQEDKATRDNAKISGYSKPADEDDDNIYGSVTRDSLEERLRSAREILTDSRDEFEDYVVAAEYINANGDLVEGSRNPNIEIPVCSGLDIIGRDMGGSLAHFHYALRTRDGEYVVRLGSALYFANKDGKLLTEGGHFIWRKGDQLFTGYGAQVHRSTGIDMRRFNSAFMAVERILGGREELASIDERMLRELKQRFEERYPENHNYVRLAELTHRGFFERREDGLYLRRRDQK